jgi:ATP-binding cassette subfamily B protein/subfamily B ATP-binding cassette protein MsbA
MGQGEVLFSMRTAFRLLRYVWPHWRGLAVVLGTMALSVGLDVLRPWPTKLLVDQVLGQQPVPEGLGGALAVLPGGQGTEGLLLWVCVATVLIFLARTVMTMLSTTASVTFGQRMVYDLGADLFAHLQRLSLLFHSRRPVGDLVGRVTGDTYCVQLLVSNAALPLLQALLTLVAMFAVMWRLERTMTLLSLGVAPFLLVLIRLFGRPMKRRGRLRRDLEGRLMSVVEESLSALPAVQAFTREEEEHARFLRTAAETVAAYRRSTFADMWFKLLTGLVLALGTAGLMWLGAHYALAGRVTVGTILVFLTYLASLYEPLNSIAFTASALQYAAANADRVVELLDTAPDVRDPPDARDVPLRGHVRYEDVSFAYEPGRPVLRGVSFEARPGEVIAVVGPSGAGKTTLINLLVRFFDPSEGRVLVDGIDVRQFAVRSLRQQVALVLQEPFLFPMTVAENIAYGRPDARRPQVEAAAVAASADAFIERLPDGYDTVIGERGATLSGGEKQRLSIARAFLKDAPVLVLDEPTAALDARTEAQLLEVLDCLMKGRTTFIIAHRLSTIRNADRILVLDQGAVVEQGRHADLLARGGLYATLYGKQMGLARHDAHAGAAVCCLDNEQTAPSAGSGEVRHAVEAGEE